MLALVFELLNEACDNIQVSRIQTTGTKGVKGFKIIPKDYSCRSLMFIPFFLSNLIVKGSPAFDYRGIMGV